MPELEWQQQVSRLGLQLMAAGTRAAYQGQLPLQLTASLDLGCVAAVCPAARNRPLGQGFELRELKVWSFSCSPLPDQVEHTPSRQFEAA
jgi:hypothetical protein